MQAVDATLVEVYGVQSTSQSNVAPKRKKRWRWGMPPLSFPEYREKNGKADGKGGCHVCYGLNNDQRHDHTGCKLNRR